MLILFSVFWKSALEVLTIIERKRAHRAVQRTKMDIKCWEDAHKACFMPLCGPLRNFGQQKSRAVALFKVQVVKMMEMLAEMAVSKQRQNLPTTNTLEFAQRLFGRWNAEKDHVAATKEREAQLRRDMAQVEVDNSLRPLPPAAVVIDPPSVPPSNLPSNPPSNNQSSTTPI